MPRARSGGSSIWMTLMRKLSLKSRSGAVFVFSAAMLLAKTRKKEVAVLEWLVVLLAFSALFYGRTFFSFVALLSLAGALALLVVKGVDPWRTFVYDLVACQVCLNALLDIRTLYSGDSGSDAMIVSRALFLPHWFWASIWLAMSLAAFSGAIYVALRASGTRLAPVARGIVQDNVDAKSSKQE